MVPPRVDPGGIGIVPGSAKSTSRCACLPGADGTPGGTVVDHVRLFPIRPGVRWTYRVHEQILPSLNRAKIPVRWTDIVIRHDGYADPELEARKLERNIKILERELTAASTTVSTVTSPGVTWRHWPPSAVIVRRCGGCGKTCWPSAQVIARRWRS
jgi:hypothetical protein